MRDNPDDDDYDYDEYGPDLMDMGGKADRICRYSCRLQELLRMLEKSEIQGELVAGYAQTMANEASQMARQMAEHVRRGAVRADEEGR